MRIVFGAGVCWLVGIATVWATAEARRSELWGSSGERWVQGGALPDFSRAGYRDGAALPQVEQAANVRDFGAVGDGVADDTRAIQAAIDATRRGAVFLPAGRYKVTDYVRLTKPGVVLRGAGPAQTTLWFPLGLDEVHPREMHDSRGIPTSGYSFDGAFLSVHGEYRDARLARIVAPARRGERAVQVDDAAGLRVGQRVMIHMQEDAAQTLKTYLYSGDPGDIRKGKQLDTKMVAVVTALRADQVELDRPLRFETRAEWHPEVRAFEPTVTEVGIEGIRFEFPARRYGGHFKENGANAIELLSVANCWVRDIVIHNGDMGVNILGCHNTVEGVVFTADTAREALAEAESGEAGCTGHHAMQCKRAEDNLVTRFEVRTRYIHDLSVEHASGNVYARGRGVDLNFDHHKDTPYENLYTAIECGRGMRVWHSGGGASLGRECAGWGTFWNIRAERPIEAPPADWGPRTMVFVGIETDASWPAAEGPWWETGVVVPEDLHAAQAELRRAQTEKLDAGE